MMRQPFCIYCGIRYTHFGKYQRKKAQKWNNGWLCFDCIPAYKIWKGKDEMRKDRDRKMIIPEEEVNKFHDKQFKEMRELLAKKHTRKDIKLLSTKHCNQFKRLARKWASKSKAMMVPQI